MSQTFVETGEVAELVEDFVDRELAGALRYENKSLLDGSGVFDLHQMAAKVYAAGYRDGHRAASIANSRQKARDL